MPEVMLEHRHWAPPHRWPLWKWPIKPSSQTTLDLFTRRNLKPTPKPKRNTLIQALPDLRPLEIAVRDRLYTRCERGQNWGHNSIFSGCNYRPRAQSKCFLGIRIVSRHYWADCLADHFWLFHSLPVACYIGAHLRGCFGLQLKNSHLQSSFKKIALQIFDLASRTSKFNKCL